MEGEGESAVTLGRCRWPSLLEREKWIPAPGGRARQRVWCASSSQRFAMDVVWTLRQAAYAVLLVMVSLLAKVRERGELRRVEWQANDHLLRMRAAARVAASRRHEPDRSEVQPRVALSVIIVAEAQRCLLAARRIAASHRPCTILSSLYHIIFPVPYHLPCTILSSLCPFLLRSLPLPSCL